MSLMAWLAHYWDDYWLRALLLVAISATITFTAGFIAWIFGAFRLDHDDVRSVAKGTSLLTLKDALPKDFSALPSQEPQELKATTGLE
jgi:hypothetical protein